MRDISTDILTRLHDGYKKVLVVSDDKVKIEKFMSGLFENEEREFLEARVKPCSNEEYNLYFCNQKSFSRLELLTKSKTRLVMLDEMEVLYDK